jgi:hypothetical protein
MSDQNNNNRFINPLCGINNTDGLNKQEPDRLQFYNCIVKDEWQQNKWTCYGPYWKPEEATELKGVYKIPKYNTSMLICTSGYLPHRVDIMKELISYSFPKMEIKSVEYKN